MRKTYPIIAFIIVILYSSGLLAQEVQLDCLKIEINGKEFKIQMNMPMPPPPPGMDSLARREYIQVMKGLNMLKDMGPRENDRGREGRRGNFPIQRVKLDSALQALEATIRHFEKEGDTVRLNLIHNTIGEMHRRAGTPRFAIESFEEVEKMAEKRGDWQEMAEAKSNIGATLLKNEQYQKALFYLEDALKIYQDLLRKKPNEVLQQQLSLLHNQLGQAYQGLSRHEDALAHYQESLQLGETLGDEETIFYANTYMGSVYQELHQLDKAKAHYQLSCEGFESTGNEEGKAHGYNQMGSVFLEQGNYIQAETYFKKGLTAAEMAQDKEQAMHSFFLLSQSARQRGDSNQAYMYYEK